MFLWIDLQLPHLKSCTSVAAVEEVLMSLPSGLRDTVLFRTLRRVTGHRPSRRRRNRSRPRSLSAAANLPKRDTYSYFPSHCAELPDFSSSTCQTHVVSSSVLQPPMRSFWHTSNDAVLPHTRRNFAPSRPADAKTNLPFRRGRHTSHPAAKWSK